MDCTVLTIAATTCLALSPVLVLFVSYKVDPDNNTTFTGNDVCPIGYYCTNGTAYPQPCPPGTFSTNTRVTSVEGCEDCPRGRYCNLQGFVKVDSAPNCAPG